jgi:isochorismate synthase
VSASSNRDLLKNLSGIIHHKALVLYRLPHTNETHLLVGDAQEIKYVTEALGNEGFLFAPAEQSDGNRKPYLILPDEQWLLDYIQALEIPLIKVPVSITLPHIATEDEYLSQANQIIQAIQAGQAQKAILSRIKKHEVQAFNPWEAYQKLCAAYPAVMVYWVSIPEVGTWMGATPETLLKIEDGQAETVSLAGTQADAGLPLSEVVWGEKEQGEQRIVSEEIAGLIEKYFPAVGVEVSGPATVSTGALLHLKTTFNWRVPQDASALGAFIKALHPTPAIVGQPREAALELITETEPHSRAYYTGLLGPVNGKGLTHLFVNLRCMQVFPGYLALYVGGGLTAASNPTAEWQETELKADTLLRVLK